MGVEVGMETSCQDHVHVVRGCHDCFSNEILVSYACPHY